VLRGSPLADAIPSPSSIIETSRRIAPTRGLGRQWVSRRVDARPGLWTDLYAKPLNFARPTREYAPRRCALDRYDREIVYTVEEATVLTEWWRQEYNPLRPHSALGYRPPAPKAIAPLPLRANCPFGDAGSNIETGTTTGAGQ
jgi:hypothetical protein